jgi:hypothetical protein
MFSRRIAAAAGAVTLVSAGLVVGVAAPASAVVFPTVNTLAGFEAALALANGNGTVDTIPINVAAAADWSYAGSQQVDEDLTIALEAGSAAVTFRSTANDALDVNGVSFTAIGLPTAQITFRSDAAGGGIFASAGTDVSLTDVKIGPAPGAGVLQLGGTFAAERLNVAGNAGGGLVLGGATGVAITDAVATGNTSTGINIETDGSAVITLTDVAADFNSRNGIRVTAGDDSVVTFTDVDAQANGSDPVVDDAGIGVYVTDTASAILNETAANFNEVGYLLRAWNAGTSIEVNSAVANGNVTKGIDVDVSGGSIVVNDADTHHNGAGQIAPLLGAGIYVTGDDGGSITFNRARVVANKAMNGAGVGIADLEEDVSLTIADSLIGTNTAVVAGLGGGIGGGIGALWTGGEPGSPISDGATVTIERSDILANEAALRGGGIAVEGMAGDAGGFFITDTQIDGNTVEDPAGNVEIAGVSFVELGSSASENPQPLVLMERTTISNNHAIGAAGGYIGNVGGLYIQRALGGGVARVDIVNSTISDNQADDNIGAAGFASNDPAGELRVSIRNSTIADNSEGVDFAGVTILGTNLTLRNSIISGSTGDDLVGFGTNTLTADYSLIQVPEPEFDAAIDAGAGNLTGVAPKLGALADNGGYTLTRIPLPGSPVLEKGDPAFAPPPAIDQRYLPRVEGRLDIGAVEAPRALAATGVAAPWWMFALAAGLLAVGGVAITSITPRRAAR